MIGSFPGGGAGLHRTLALLGLWLWALPDSQLVAQGTILSGTLLGPEGAQVSGAAVHVLDSTGTRVEAVLSNGQGRFRFSLEAPGTYRLRIERIGFETEETSDLVVGIEEEHRVIPLRVRPVEIDPIRVTSERICRAEANRNPELLLIWSEARKALTQTTLSVDTTSRGFQVEVSERTLSPKLGVLGATSDTLPKSDQPGFTFQPIAELGARGWGQSEDELVTTLYGPSPDAFLSSWFGATHCLSLEEEEHPQGFVGLAFESIEDSLQVGLTGTFWIEPESWHLRQIDFRYTGTPELDEADHQGGTVILHAGSDGQLYAAAWSVVGPVLEPWGVRYVPFGQDLLMRRGGYRVSGYLEHAGRLLEPYEVPPTATSPWATRAALEKVRPSPASRQAAAVGAAIRAACPGFDEGALPAVVAGTVTDSLTGHPLSGASVRLEAPGGPTARSPAFETRTDTLGYYQFCHAPPGEEVELSATIGGASAEATVRAEAGTLHVEHIKIPLSDHDRPGVLLGRVLDAETRGPVEGARVTLDKVDGATVLTNRYGYFSLGPQPWGTYHLSVTGLGYALRQAAVRLEGGLTQTVEIELAADPIPIEGLEVVVRDPRTGGQMEDLIRRMHKGFGTFLTRDVIEARPSARAAELLREVPGIQVSITGPTTVNLVVRGKGCLPRVIVDGVPWRTAAQTALTSMYADQIEAIEVYKGFAEVPGEFMGNGPPPCAVVVIWTRWMGGGD